MTNWVYYFSLGIGFLIRGYLYVVLFVVFSSWIPPLYNSKFMKPFKYLADAFMQPFRGILVLGMLDFTPVIGFALLELVYRVYLFLI